MKQATTSPYGANTPISPNSNHDKLVEWKRFAHNHFTRPRDIRYGKRMIDMGEIPGRIIDGEPYVYEQQWILLQNGAPNSVDEIAQGLLS